MLHLGLVIFVYVAQTEGYYFEDSSLRHGGHCGHLDREYRQQCGHVATSEPDCLALGCCFDSTIHPRCYMGNIGYMKPAWNPDSSSMLSTSGYYYPAGAAMMSGSADDKNSCYLQYVVDRAKMFVDLGTTMKITSVTITNRPDDKQDELAGLTVYISPYGSPTRDTQHSTLCGNVPATFDGAVANVVCSDGPVLGRYVYFEDSSRWAGLCNIYISGEDYNPQCDLVVSEAKVSCGAPGISVEACIAAGCCYRATGVGHDHHCFYGNVAVRADITASMTDGHKHAGVMVDGVTDNNYYYRQTAQHTSTPNHIRLDLGHKHKIHGVVLYAANTQGGYDITVANTNDTNTGATRCINYDSTFTGVKALLCGSGPVIGRYVYITARAHAHTALYEIAVVGEELSGTYQGPPAADSGEVDVEASGLVLDRGSAWHNGAGTVTGFKVAVGERNPVHLAYWRHLHANIYSYVGGVDFTPRSTGLVEVPIDADHTFDIQNGDIPGVQWVSGGAVRYVTSSCGAGNSLMTASDGAGTRYLPHQHKQFTQTRSCGYYQIQPKVAN